MITARRLGESYETGREAEAGTYKCGSCGVRIGLDHLEELPRCPACGGTRFRRARLFDTAKALELPTATLRRSALNPPHPRPSWLAGVRAELEAGERYMAYERDGGVETVRLPVGWSRIGRSITCDIRLDDPTVSRRHALVVNSASGAVRVLDDRSLNGVELNGSPVEWGTLADGDELSIGRFRLYLVALEPAASREAEASLVSG